MSALEENGEVMPVPVSSDGAPRIGVYVCHCGTNIAAIVDVAEVAELARGLDSVVVARDYKYMCSDPGQKLIKEDIAEFGLDRVVVASCSPRMHELTFRRACQSAGLNPYLFAMANIREHCSWVHEDHELATEKAGALVRAAVERVYYQQPLETHGVPVNPNVLVVGGGIAGIQAALEIADSEHQVYLVEREPSIGGHMAQFDKTFPTLDCAACILTPKMVSVGQHPHVELMTYSEVVDVSGFVGNYKVQVRRKARYVDEDKCTGCGLCQTACTWKTDSEFDMGLGKRSAIFTPFPQAVPLVPVIDREGTSPCTFACPAGIKAHGYVSLIRAGEYEKAFQLVLEATPLVGILGRACYGHCEAECSRGSLEGTLPIRRLKRFIADAHYGQPSPTPIEVPPPNGKSVAVVGSGPAGLTAAWHLGRKGYRVKIFESAPEPGGMIRTAVPEYRLPAAVVERDIANVTSLGVEIATNSEVSDLDELKREGYDAILVAIGTPVSSKLGVPGEDLEGVVADLKFLRAVRLGQPADLRGKRVVIVGGGNTAMDAARTALRLGAEEVVIAYRRGRAQMPASADEIEGAELEGVRFELLVQPVEVLGADGRVTGLRCVRNQLGEPDASGRRRPEPIPCSEFDFTCDVVIAAIGIQPDVDALAPKLLTTKAGTIDADPGTLQTEIPHVFAAGDVVLGPLDITNASGHGQRAAFMIDRWLRTGSLEEATFDYRLPAVDKDAVVKRVDRVRQEPLATGVPFAATPSDFAEIESPLTEEEARYSAERCLDCGPCSECGECIGVCEPDAIDLLQPDRVEELEVGSIIVATGFSSFDADRIPRYGYGRLPNVITSLEAERLANASGPTGGKIVLKDGGVPESVGIIHCVGSRDVNYNVHCSRVCCMASLKLAHLVKEKTGAEVYNFYIDMRAAGKGYEEFYGRVMAEGTHVVRGRVAEVIDSSHAPEEEGHLIVQVEDTLTGLIRRIPMDMVILAVGMEPRADVAEVARLFKISRSGDGFFLEKHPKLDPVATTTDGVFVVGCCQGPKDIPDTVAQASAAAARALSMISKGEVIPEAATAKVDEAMCQGCGRCEEICEFGAPIVSLNGRLVPVSSINEALCKGCGACAVACPTGAISVRHFTRQQILAEIEALSGVLV